MTLDRNNRQLLALLARRAERRLAVTIPATAVAQAMRSPARRPDTDFVALHGPDATAVGRRLARTGTADLAHPHVVLCAQRAGQVVVTSDAEDLRRIDSGLRLIVV